MSTTEDTDVELTAVRVPELPQLPPATGIISDPVRHPQHYGGADDPYEAIKVIDAWDLGFNLGSAVKYIARAGRKPGSPYVEDLRKAVEYLQFEIERANR